MSPILKDELEQQLMRQKRTRKKFTTIQYKTKRTTLRSKTR